MTYPDVKKTIKQVETLVNIPGPSGYAYAAIQYCQDYLQSHDIGSIVTNKGGLSVTIKGADDTRHRFITAHVDTLGAMVKDILPNGRLKMTKIGGFSWHATEGEYCQIHSTDRIFTGTICLHETSVHVYSGNEDIKRDDDHMEVRIDEVTSSAEETYALGINVGDFICFDPRFQHTKSGFLKSRHLDDKVSAAILLELLVHLKENDIQLPHTTHFFFSNNEEIGYGGNSNIPREVVEYLAVDMGALGDGQLSDEYTVSICAKDSSGPYHYHLRQHLIKLCQANEIDYKIDIYPYYGSDASAAISAGHDIRHALFGAGIESSHAMERTHERSIQATESLLYAYVQSPLI